jgi:hypothetical protein
MGSWCFEEIYCLHLFFFICIVGDGIKIHSTLRPLNGLLCQPRVIMIMEKSVEWLAVETEVLGENLPQCRFVHHKPPHAARTRTRAAAVGSQRLTAELRHGHCLHLHCQNIIQASNKQKLSSKQRPLLSVRFYSEDGGGTFDEFLAEYTESHHSK